MAEKSSPQFERENIADGIEICQLQSIDETTCTSSQLLDFSIAFYNIHSR